ncbi:MAG: hypothetical protein IPP19_09280 [Verrucomicrobia bacterium]|nr:hypothetical protein [Verrucomicrobiota bacterium]
MRRFTTVLLLVLLATISRGFALAAWPSAEGEIVGELKLFDRSPEFLLPWKLAFKKGETGEQAFIYKIAASGTQLMAGGRINLLTGEGTWRIEEARVDAAVWLALIAPQLSPALASATAQGTLTLSGEGTLRQGQAVGRLTVEWRDGVLTHATQGWTLEGIAFEGEFAIDIAASRLVSTAPFELTVRTVTHPRFGARSVFIQAFLNEQRSLFVTAARVEIAGGEMVSDPCEVQLFPVSVDMNLHIDRVGLQDIVLLVPAAGLAEARGRIDGVVRLKWSAATDFQLGVGSLSLHNDEPTVVRLSPALGLLTGHVPERFDLLPAWLGPLARWIRPVNPAYADMKAIELGKADLRVKTLDVKLTPEGDERGRSATVRLVAQPEQAGGAVKEVTFDVNVAGPLNAVLKLGMKQNFSLETH